MPDRPPAEDVRPTLLTRWTVLMELGKVAHLSSLLAFFTMTQAVLNIPDSWPYVAAVFSLQLGLLVVLDYRDWVRHKVQQEVSKLDPSLSVSSVLLLSSPELQDQYYKWMDKTPAVAQHPYFAPFFHICGALKMLSKDGEECKACALIVPLPSMVLAFVRVAMENGGAPKQFQSIASLVATAYMVTAATGILASNDRCMLSMGPDWTSPAGNAVFVAILTALEIGITPCTMQHLVAVCVIAGPWDFLGCYIRCQRRHGGRELSSYPTHHAELIIIVAAAKTATLLVGAAVRYRLAHENMTAFLRSVRPHRH